MKPQCSSADAENVYAVLSARLLKPGIFIEVPPAAQNPRLD